jgi:hypothetical protein
MFPAGSPYGGHMTTSFRITALAALLSFAACGPDAPASPEATAARSIDVVSAAQAMPPVPTPTLGLAWTTEAVQGTISAIAPVAGGGAVALLSQPLPRQASVGAPLALGWFGPGGALLAARSLVAGSAESIELARPGLVATPDGWAVLGVNLTCSGAGCPDLGEGPLASGAHLVALSPGGELLHLGLGEGEVQSLAVNAAGQVAVAFSGPGGASVRVLDRSSGVVLDVFMDRIGGPMRIAFTPEGDLVVGRDSMLQVFAADGRSLVEVDFRRGVSIEAVAAAGDAIAVAGDVPGLGGVVAVLDGTGALRWAARTGRVDALAIEPGGAVVLNAGDDAWKLDGAGMAVWRWPAAQGTVFPPAIDVDAVAFVGGQLVAGGVFEGRAPFLVVLNDPAPSM